MVTVAYTRKSLTVGYAWQGQTGPLTRHPICNLRLHFYRRPHADPAAGTSTHASKTASHGSCRADLIKLRVARLEVGNVVVSFYATRILIQFNEDLLRT